MRALTALDGWLPLTVWAPSRTQGVVKSLRECGFSSPPEPLREDEWRCLGDLVRALLEKGHQQAMVDSGAGGLSLLTVHGEVRLTNVMARRDASSGFEVQFVDFGWAGINGKSRFESRVNHLISD